VLGGVAAGLADYLDVDPVLVRLGFIFLALLHGLGVLFYLACWLSMPARLPAAAAAATGEAPVTPAAEDWPPAGRPGPRRARLLFGCVLVFVGTAGLLDRLSWLDWLDWERLADFWPMVLVAMGVALILGSRGGQAQ